MLFEQNEEKKVYPHKPQFCYIKVGFKGVKIIRACFCDVWRHTEVFEMNAFSLKKKQKHKQIIIY